MPLVQTDSGFQIIGHRGAAGHGPENTQTALLAGLRLGAGAVEIDVQFTSDGVPVVYHDRTLERMAGVKGRIRESTARELSGYDIGFKFGDDHRGLRILTLDEAAALVPKHTALHVEVKEYDTVSGAHLKEMLAVLRRRGGLERCVVSSFSAKILVALRGLEAKLHRGLLVSGRARGLVDQAVEIGCTSLHPEAGHTDAALVSACRSAKLKIFPYTANDAALFKHLLSLGVDGIYTDYPGRLAEIVGGSRHPGRPSRHASGAETRVHVDREEAARPAGDGRAEDAEMKTAPIASEEAAEPSPGEAGRKKRRRGRRGGRRHRKARPADAQGAAGQDAPAGEGALETRDDAPEAGESMDAEMEPEAAEPDGAAEASPVAAPAGTQAGANAAAEALRKKRRRGRRGGRRHREKRLGKQGPPSGGGPAAGPSDTGSTGDPV
jgi:glycerophosphoryl diester phosphodiesterase